MCNKQAIYPLAIYDEMPCKHITHALIIDLLNAKRRTFPKAWYTSACQRITTEVIGTKTKD